MKHRFLLVAGIVLCAGLLLTGCDKLKSKGEANAKAAEDKANAQAQAMVRGRLTGQPQTAYGSAMERAKSTDCLNQMNNLRGFWAAEEYLPTSAKDFPGAGSALKCPGSGKDYEFLVSGRVRNAGKVPVLRCPTHDLVLWSDGSASRGR